MVAVVALMMLKLYQLRVFSYTHESGLKIRTFTQIITNSDKTLNSKYDPFITLIQIEFFFPIYEYSINEISITEMIS